MTMRGSVLALACLITAGCSEPQQTAPVTDNILLEVAPARITAPNGSMTLLYDGETNPTLTLSAGFLRRSPVGAIQPVSRLSWAPNSERFYVNDSGNAAWSRLRVWNITARAQAVEVPAISDAAVAELARRNGCTKPDETEYTTHGMGWDKDGAQIYVLAQVRRQVNCASSSVEYLIALIDVRTARIVAVEQDAAARSRWPSLPWGP